MEWQRRWDSTEKRGTTHGNDFRHFKKEKTNIPNKPQNYPVSNKP